MRKEKTALVLITFIFGLIISGCMFSNNKVSLVEIKSTPFFLRNNGGLNQIIGVTAQSLSKKPILNAKIEFRTQEGKTLTFLISELKPGLDQYHISFPEVKIPTPVSIKLLLGKQSCVMNGTIYPQKKWLIFAAPNVHTDIGFTDTQERVTKIHTDNFNIAIDACKKNKDFKWNAEVSWQIEKFINNGDDVKINELFSLMRENRIGVQSLYLNMLTGLCSSEELNRLCYFTGSLRRKYDIPVELAAITDVPTYVRTLPTILAQSGIKYFIGGIHQDRTAFLSFTDIESPFWWVGPDGSKVLCWFSDGYAQLSKIGLFSGESQIYKNLKTVLSDFEKKKYPFDAILLYGVFYENEVLNPIFADTASQWNTKWAYPKIIIAKPEEFFKYIDTTENQEKIPSFKGDGGAYWEDGALSSIYETVISRKVKERIISAEKLFSFISMVNPNKPYPFGTINSAWRNILLYDEHTWGASVSISEPKSKMTQDQWQWKSQCIYDAASQVQGLLNDGLHSLAQVGSTGNGYSILVFNQLSFPRNGLVKAVIPKVTLIENGFRLVDRETKKQIPYTFISLNEIYFYAEDLPALGYKCYDLIPGAVAQDNYSTVTYFSNGMENKYYRINFDSPSGAITSIYDKEIKEELIDTRSPYKFNQYLYISTPDFYKPFLPTASSKKPHMRVFAAKKSRFMWGQNNSVFGSMIVLSSCRQTPKIKTQIILYNNIKRIDIINEIYKKETLVKEAVFISFPFNTVNPSFNLEIPNGSVNPAKDQLVGACKNWYAVQHFVDVSDNKKTITLATPDVPMILLNEINLDTWLKKNANLNGTIFSYLMNNLWHTNYKASQGGSFVFRYSITSSTGSSDRTKATQFGHDYANPPLSIFLEPGNQGKISAGKTSFCSIDQPNAVITTVKKAEDDSGFIVRILETAGKDCEVKLSLGSYKIRQAWLCNLVEDKLCEIGISGNEIRIPIKSNSITTILVK